MLRFYLIDFELVMCLSLPVHIPISLFQINQCGLGGIFWLDGLVFWWVLQNLWVSLVATFFGQRLESACH